MIPVKLNQLNFIPSFRFFQNSTETRYGPIYMESKPGVANIR